MPFQKGHDTPDHVREKIRATLKRKGIKPKQIFSFKGLRRNPNFSKEAYAREWEIKNRDKRHLINHRRRMKLKNCLGSHTLGEWEMLKAQYDWRCPSCLKREPEIKLTEDHIVPVSRGGSDNIENIQPLCKPCNSSKKIKIIKYPNHVEK